MSVSITSVCKNGHIAPRYKSGNCSQCEKERYHSNPARKEYNKKKSAERRARIKADPISYEEHKKYMKEYVSKNKDTLNAKQSIRYYTDPRKRLIIRLKRLKVPIEDWLLDYLLQHNGTCDLCGSLPDGKWKELSIDHCHSTNQFRGMLCTECNTGIGKFKDNPELLNKAARYVKHYQTTS